ncbi:polysaccharide biosynthesis/export family protein [Methylobacterium pseudosasicola]|uniref:Exopolysaccharide production protein ExoF n=1 Tax=Methylobacterium pseudosasicola TaxID=582667 RepID=A0A1I4VDL9_9HYPH|nr:polysaccharide biosynthesis/export family protein [Methylobacterium pseudosasicola]SFM99324.1 exopolysaccharide production protein ExoF [Methylobacterium pseudosasicola]
MKITVVKTVKIALSCFFLLLNGIVGAASSEYKLGPQDVIQIKVFDLRAGSGEAHQWTAFDGDIIVNAGGSISLPLLGAISVNGITVENLGKLIAERMQARIGLAELPSASVQVTKYRPFYIGGAAEKPGEYEYRPNITAGQALTIAGGVYRLTPSNRLSFDRDLTTQHGEINLITRDNVGLLMREERLNSEIEGRIKFVLADKFLPMASQPEYSNAFKAEELLFEARKSSLDYQVKTISETKMALAKEIEALDKKSQSIDRQIELTQKDLNQVRDLVSKGLSVSTRQLAAEQNAAAFENTRLDIQLARLRAQQELGKLSRETIQLQSKMKQEAITELAQIQAKLLQNRAKENTAASVMKIVEQTVKSNGGLNSNVSYIIHRLSPEGPKTIFASDDDLIEPGDVLDIKLTE